MSKSTITSFILCTCLLLLNLSSCTKNDSDPTSPPLPVVNKCNGQEGKLFTAVKALIAQKCVNCHNSTNPRGGINLAVDCNIINNQARIKARAVDLGDMPPSGPLPQVDKDKITAWINAGGSITN